MLLVALVIACAAHVATETGKVADLSYNAVTFGASVVALWYAWRLGKGPRLPWMWIAAGILCSGLADLIFTVIVWTRDGAAPDASVADLFWLASYVLITGGLLSMLGLHTSEPGQRKRYDMDALIDLGSFIILAVLTVTQLAGIGDIFATTEVSATVQVIWAAYPILDAALLAVLVRAIFGRRVLGASGVLLAFGTACWLAADLATLLLADASTISIWMNLGWMLGAASMGAAARFGRTVTTSAVRTRRRDGARVLISLSPLLLPAVIETWTYFNDEDPNPIPFLVATVALILLAYFRSTRLVNARDTQEAALIENRSYFEALARNSADAVVVIDRGGVIKSDATQLAAMLGGIDNPIGANVVHLLDAGYRERAVTELHHILSTTGVVHEFDIRALHADGAFRWFGVRAINLLGDPTVRGIIVNVHDVTDRKIAEEELTHRAFHDALTGLANRALFLDRVEHALQRSTSSGADVAVIYLDVDGFKTVNDSRGHEAGDQILREIADRLTSAVRAGDTVARLGGDEFAILIDQDPSSGDEAQAAAERVLRELNPPMHLGDSFVVLSASIGITYGESQATASSMLRDADIAMYKSKTTGKSRWTVYDTHMRLAALERAELETDLVNALRRNQFRLVYQPIIELLTEEVVGFEALLRWDHPTKGEVLPDSFVPIAEDNGSIVPIGQWVLDEACRTGAQFQLMYPQRHLTMAVNLSARQLATSGIVDHVATALRQSGLPARSLILEMTESALVEDAPTAAKRLHQLRALGVRLAIDDFGTGYSSLSYLRQFPIDILKIDRSFTSSITDRDNIPAIVRGLLDLGKTLQLETIAEGIELGVQRDTLRDQKCEFGQGFLFARPLTVSDCKVLLTRLDERDTQAVSAIVDEFMATR